MKVRLRDWLTPKLPALSTPNRTCHGHRVYWETKCKHTVEQAKAVVTATAWTFYSSVLYVLHFVPIHMHENIK